MEFTTATGSIYYEVLASTSTTERTPPTVTLLHNFMSSGQTAWGPLLPGLRQHYRVLLPDLPGHGRSQGYPALFDHTEIARQLAALMQAEQAEQGHLAGCSSGGMIAQLLVDNQLVHPKTLTLISTTHSTNAATTGSTAIVTPENFKAGRNWMAMTAKLHDPHHYDGYYHEVLLPNFRQLNAQNAIDLPLTALETWTLPVCIIHGAEDEFFPTFIVDKMATALPDAELHIVPNQTHALIFRQSGTVRDLMLDFLQRHP
ncbi:MAG: alpha/beta hydrolase [Chloroflexi bacterium]|nr:alpha/beta hydrolase [Chloroflexota bacterium]